jgi:hypothetical protein
VFALQQRLQNLSVQSLFSTYGVPMKLEMIKKLVCFFLLGLLLGGFFGTFLISSPEIADVGRAIAFHSPEERS